jgi:hypothetical protein
MIQCNLGDGEDWVHNSPDSGNGDTILLKFSKGEKDKGSHDRFCVPARADVDHEWIKQPNAHSNVQNAVVFRAVVWKVVAGNSFAWINTIEFYKKRKLSHKTSWWAKKKKRRSAIGRYFAVVKVKVFVDDSKDKPFCGSKQYLKQK